MNIDAITNAPLHDRMRWFADLNRWLRPTGFPIDLPDYEGDSTQIRSDANWKAAWSAVTSSLTDEESSLGWWLYALNKTEAEWRIWWTRERIA